MITVHNAYDEAGRLLRTDDRLNGSSHFDLDAAGRVTGVTARGWTESYAHDGAGNQTSAE
ncbi:RHS repeat domain-containing protein [Streptomyces coeruleorubidus]|uniref:RHS repeat domain-containing protein n=1 Tax=Streptomyces coeruleorubidus TaxID=116188 RepID=UPI003CD028CA